MTRNAKHLQRKAKLHGVIRLDEGYFSVLSSSSGNKYHVKVLGNGGLKCSCRWAEDHKTDWEPCSHCLAVEQFLAVNRKLSFWGSEEEAKRQHRPIRRIGLHLWATSRA